MYTTQASYHHTYNLFIASYPPNYRSQEYRIPIKVWYPPKISYPQSVLLQSIAPSRFNGYNIKIATEHQPPTCQSLHRHFVKNTLPEIITYPTVPILEQQNSPNTQRPKHHTLPKQSDQALYLCSDRRSTFVGKTGFETTEICWVLGSLTHNRRNFQYCAAQNFIVFLN